MTRTNLRSIASYFDRCAHDGRMLELADDESAQLEGCLHRWQIERGLRVLEPGCGAGRFTQPLARAVGAEGLVLGCDLSPAMLARARRRPMDGRAAFILASAETVPVRAGFFDRVLLINVFPHLVQPRAVLAEMERVLTPDGSLWIHHFISRDQLNALHRQLEPPVCDHHLQPADSVAALLDDVGLSVRSTRDDRDGYSVHAVRRRV